MQTYFDASINSATMNSATLALLLLCIIILAIVVIRYRSAKKKYEHPAYLHHLATIKIFIEEVNSLNDYVTWVARDGIKTRYALAGRYFNASASSATMFQ